jgi:hypothetical protein
MPDNLPRNKSDTPSILPHCNNRMIGRTLAAVRSLNNIAHWAHLVIGTPAEVAAAHEGAVGLAI